MLKRLRGMQKIIVKLCGKCFNKKPNDFVIATGKQYSIKQFINLVGKKTRNEN